MSQYVGGYIGRGTSINLEGFGATRSSSAGFDPMAMFNTITENFTRTVMPRPPAPITSATTAAAVISPPAPSNKGKYLLAGVGAVGVIGLLALVLKKKK